MIIVNGAITAGGTAPMHNNWNLSANVGFLPFIEQQPVWELLSNPYTSSAARGDTSNNTYPAMGPPPGGNGNQYSPWRTQVSTFLCPSHPAPIQNVHLGKSCYPFCYGDFHLGSIGPAIANLPGRRGMFRNLTHPALGTAGASPSGAALSQGSIGWSACVIASTAHRTPSPWVRTDHNGPSRAKRQCDGCFDSPKCHCRSSTRRSGRDPSRQNYYVPNGTGIAVASLQVGVGGGERWMQDQDNFFNTIVPPNGPSICQVNANNACTNNIMLTAGSYHQGGCHVLMLDGAVKFVTSNIDAGDKNVGVNLNADSGLESPRGIWGAMALVQETKTKACSTHTSTNSV